MLNSDPTARLSRCLVAWLTLGLMLLSDVPAQDAGRQGIGYVATELPLEPLTTPRLNDKGQVVVMDTGNGVIQMYLPTADYGRAPGVHTFPTTALSLIQFNTKGSILIWTGAGQEPYALWRLGEIVQFEHPIQASGLNNADQVVGWRNYIPPPAGRVALGTTVIGEPDGTVRDLIDLLPHEGVPGRDTQYSFHAINDLGVIAGSYADPNSFAISHDDEWHLTTWNSDTGGSPRRHVSPSIQKGHGQIIRALNNKNQFLAEVPIPSGRVEALYLPEPDYGMSAGFNILTNLETAGVWNGWHKVTDHGEVFKNLQNVRHVWFRGKPINPSKLLTDGKTSDVLQIHDVNNKGAVLGTGAIMGKPNRLVLYEPAISASVEIVPEDVAPGDTFEMRVTIVNESDEPFVLAGVFGETYRVTGSALPGFTQLVNPPATRYIAPGQSWRQDFSYRVNRAGEVQIEFKAVGFHAGGARFLTDLLKPVVKVLPAGDLLIKRDDEPVDAYSGDDLFLPDMDARQHRYAAVAQGETNRFNVRLQNDAKVAQSFVLRASAVGLESWDVSYLRGNADITAAVFGPGWTTPQLAAGAALDLSIDVIDKDEQLGERLTLRSAVTGSGSSETVDAVTVITVVAEVPISTEIKRVVEGGYTQQSVARGLSDVDAPLELVSAMETLDAQPTIEGGWVADGVTPLLVKMSAEQHALEDFPEGRRFRLDLSLAGGGELEGEDLQDRLRLLQEGAWVAGNEFELSPEEDRVFAMLTPVLSDEVRLGERTWQLTIAFEVVDVATGKAVSEGTWLLRKPPVALIHGYNTTGEWGDDFVNELAKTRPLAGTYKWIKLAKYGQESGHGDYVTQMLNTLLHLPDLVPMAEGALEGAMLPLRQEWAFTRYDVVCHSQGGLLTRMLCSKNASTTLSRPFRNEENFNRGRFHRVVTLGSPHNGTRLLRYLLALDESKFGILKNNLPTLIGKVGVFGEVAQAKFDPFGIQIRDLNNPASNSRWAPDPGAKFHLVRSTVNAGKPPHLANFTPSYVALGLNHPETGPAVIPRGSDGVVDFDSMGAHGSNETAPANVYTLPPDLFVSHSPPLEAFGADVGQTASANAGVHVRGVLDQEPAMPAQDRVFGSFHVPALLDESIREEIDHWAQASIFEVLETAINPSPQAAALRAAAAPGAGPKTFVLDTPADWPVVGQVSWLAEAFTKDGIGNGGVSLEADPADSRRVMVTIPDRMAGDVVLYANYVSTNGVVVFAAPTRIFSAEPAGVTLVGIETEPSGGEFPVGSELPVEITARYSDGQLIVRHVNPEEVTAVSSAPGVISSANSLNWQTLSPGSAQIVVEYRGFFATNSLTVVPSPSLEAPSLSATRNGSSIVLQWPASATGYEIESSPSLAPGLTWQNDNAAAVTEGETKTLTLDIIGNRFFRLRRAGN